MKKRVLGFGIVIFLLGANHLEILGPLRGFGFSREIVADQNELLRLTLSPDEKYRIFRRLQDIDPHLIEAVLLLEDRHFYHHWGVNPISLIRAFGTLAQDRPVGASTLTMQLVRLREKIYTKSILGKLRQMGLAVAYEFLYSKKQILEAYLNLAPYGANIEGVGAAARIYFGKEVSQLDLAEALSLAVIPQNPLRRSLNQDDLRATEAAKLRLAQSWYGRHPQDRAVSIEMQLPQISKKLAALPFLAPHFVDRALARDPFNLQLRTTLNLDLQSKFEASLKAYVYNHESFGVQNASALLIDTRTREIKAWVGSADFGSEKIQGQIDGITTRRSPGSTLKPFLYALALDQGLIHSETMLKDTPTSFGPYDPENFDRSYKGPLSATEALVQSRNVPAVALAAKLKSRTLYQLLKLAQVQNLRDEKFYGLAIALGNSELTPEDLGGLYTALANQGRWSPLRWQQTISEAAEKNLFSPEAAFITAQMLRENPRSESSLINEAQKLRFPVAWKTGTSYGFRDAWTAGLIGPYAIVVWIGNFDDSSNNAFIGREIAAPLFFQLVDLLPKKELKENLGWTNSFGLNLKKVQVCSVSGLIPNEFCPHHKSSWFIPGVSPIGACDLHREIILSKSSGLRLCDVQGEDFIREVFEFWPSDLLQLFARGGLQRRLPPAFEPTCLGLNSDSFGLSPQVISPKTEVDYMISYQKNGAFDQIPLKAIADADVKKLTWYINHKLAGQVPPEETLMSTLGPGHYEVLVVDDHGRSASRSLEVKLIR